MDVKDITIFDCLNNNILVQKDSCIGRDIYEMKVLEFSPNKQYVKVEWRRSDDTRYKEWLEVRIFTSYSTYQKWIIVDVLGPKKSLVKKFSRIPKDK